MRLVFLALSLSSLLHAQIYAPRPPVATKTTGTLGQLLVTFRGTLIELNKKEVVIDSDQETKVTLLRTHRTKFMRDGKQIKPGDIPVGAPLTIDVTKDPDQNLQAVLVIADQPKAPQK